MTIRLLRDEIMGRSQSVELMIKELKGLKKNWFTLIEHEFPCKMAMSQGSVNVRSQFRLHVTGFW